MFVGAMSPTFSAAGAEFLQHYARDAQIRWSLEDLAAQREFVNTRLAGCQWLDCSTASAALQLVQAVHAQTSLGTHEKYDALVLAGPIVELIPCLRDNSPESEHFMRHAAAMLWPYYTAEELVEMLGENGLREDSRASGFTAIPQFNDAVLEGRLGFTGFAKIFKQLAAEGYDPREVGWGELRFVARLE